MKKRIFSIFLTLCIFLMLLPMTVFAQPTIWYVKTDGAGTGSSWENASSNLNGIIAGASENDQVWVAAGTYTPGTNETDTFTLKKGVKVYGGFAGTETDLNQRNWENNVTVLSGNNVNYHVVTGQANATSDDTRLDGFTIKLGNAIGTGDNKYGGGMFNKNGSSPTVANCIFSGNTADHGGGGMANTFNSNPSLENCTFTGNTSFYGGGIFNENSSPTLENCIFTANTAMNGNGGGMYSYGSDSGPTVENCSFSGNTATYGGGMYNDGCSATVTNCTFSGNTATYDGGGICNSSCSPAVTNCIFTGNTATNGDGGGMYTAACSPTVKNCTFTGNTATNGNGGGMSNTTYTGPAVENCSFSGNTAGYGGGMSNSDSSPTLVNCTFSGNTATSDGGGMYNAYCDPAVSSCTFSGNTANAGGGMFNNTSGLTLANTIVWGNTAPAGQGPDIYQDGVNLTLNHCVVDLDKYNSENAPTENFTGVIQTDPKLILLDKNGNIVTDPDNVWIYGLAYDGSAINAGLGVGEAVNAAAIPNQDQRGTARPQGTGVDIGAFEAVLYTVSYDNNGGEGSMTADNAVPGVPFELPTCTFTAPAGKRFKTWAIGGAESATTADANTTYTFTGDTTVYAVWENIPVTGVNLDVILTTLYVGDVKTLTATVSPDNAGNKNVNWSSSNTGVASVENNGKVTAVAPGTAVITATTEDGDKTASCTVTVVKVTMTEQPPPWTKGSGTPAAFTSSADKADFLYVMVDDRVVDPENYDVSEGSTVITFKSGFLESLSPGIHIVEIVSRTGTAQGTLEIKTPAVYEVRQLSDPKSSVPKLGDGMGIYMYPMLMLISVCGIILLIRRRRA